MAGDEDRQDAGLVQELPENVRRYLGSVRAESTLRAYEKALRSFCAWCAENGHDAEQPTDAVVASYLADSAMRLRPNSLQLHLAAIITARRARGVSLDASGGISRQVMRGIARQHPDEPRRAAALTVSEIRRMVEACRDGLAGLRDRALILVGFAGAFRRSELSGMCVGHLAWASDGVRILVPRSKEDQEGRGETVTLPNGANPETCPVRSLQAWLDGAGIAAGPVFRKVDRWGSPSSTALTGDGVNSILIRCAGAAGLVADDGRALSSHGLRAGFVTEAYRAGVLDEEIMQHTRHRGLRTMRGYVRREKLSQTSPAGRVGL